MLSSLTEISNNELIIEKEVKKDDLIDIVFGDYNKIEKLNALIDIYNKRESMFVDAVERLCNIYNLSPTKGMLSLLVSICIDTDLESKVKLYIASNISGDENAYLEAVSGIVDNTDVNPIMRAELYSKLINKGMYDTKGLEYILSDIKYEENKRYKILHTLRIDDVKSMIELYAFAFQHFRDISTRILCAQYLLQQNYNEYEISKWLLRTSRDSSINYKVRAEAADIVTLLGSDDDKKEASILIREMGSAGHLDTIYTNKENVHNIGVMASVKNMINLLKDVNPEFTFEDLYSHFDNKEVLERISRDNVYYGTMTIRDILCRVFTEINNMNDGEKQLHLTRLIGDLNEMDGTCTSGHVARIVNSLSGYKEYNVSISFEDQISSNIQGRIRKRIMDIKDEELSEKVYNQMTEQGYSVENKEFNKFFANNIVDIYKEMKEEFKTNISCDEFDVFFRTGVMKFRGHTGNETQEFEAYESDNEYDDGDEVSMEDQLMEMFNM